LTVSAAFGQGVLTVSKNKNPDADQGMYTSIQAAVNAAEGGQIIQILDTEVYEEQVTIDGRDVSTWDGKNQPGVGGTSKVVGKKNGITIRYVPPASARLFGNHARPTIRFKDVVNHSPKSDAEGKVEGDTLGSSGNFETCGALRIIRAQGVTIDGIKVDGGGKAPFGTAGVWNTNLFHGNAAIAVVVSGGTVIRNCDITNGYFGIAVKDRNTGGVFGNPNPGDNDKTIPLSGFGKVGNHLFEYNKIHANMTGIYTESAWDLATTIRYNLIYSNIHDTSILTGIPGNGIAEGGAILFRDCLFTPHAIYNNTFYNNTRNIMGGWKASAPHLLFNNIFGTPNAFPNGKANTMTLEDKFPYRMHNSVFSATGQLESGSRFIDQCRRAGNYNVTPQIPEISGQNISGITQVQVPPMPQPSTGATTVNCIGELASLPPVTVNDFIPAGARLTNAAFAASAELRWLETTRSVSGTENLFVSTDSSSADFLRPIWTHKLVEEFIKGKGWKTVGMKNSDGSDADIGAVPSTGRAPATQVRIKPSNVVLVDGTKANASYYVTVTGGQMKSPSVKFLRWVAPLPTAEGVTPVPSGSHHVMTPPAAPAVVVNGNNTPQFTIEALPVNTDTAYGFFEIVVAGKDADGKDITSDIGFLPYRKLSYTLKIDVYTAAGKKVDTVTVGEQYRIHVTPCKGSDPKNCGKYEDAALNEVSYELQSNAAAYMYKWGTETALTQDGPSPSANITNAGKDYNVYFTRAGKETIMGTGVAPVGTSGGRLVFIGTTDIVVRPGAPESIVFVSPISDKQRGGAVPTVINKGANFTVQVKVADKYGNAVDNVDVAIKSDKPAVGNVAAPGQNITVDSPTSATVKTDPETGFAVFNARVTKGNTREDFKMTASFSSGGKSGSDDGTLRVGKSLDKFEVFYSDNEDGKLWEKYYNPEVKIEGDVGQWFKVTVKVVVGDSVNTSSEGRYLFVSSEADLVFSKDSAGSTDKIFDIKNGVATFWVSAAPGTNTWIRNARIDVFALDSRDPDDIDGSIGMGGRGGITFKPYETSISHAVVYGNGKGQPDSLLVYYLDGSAPLTGAGAVLPNRVTLNWSGVKLVAGAAAITARGAFLLHANFTGLGDNRPTGLTFINGNGKGLAELIGGAGGENAGESGFPVYDGIGPLLTKGDPNDGFIGSEPLIYEYDGDSVGVDTLIVTLSEGIADKDKLKLLYSFAANPGDPADASDGARLEVLNVASMSEDGRSWKLAVRHTPAGPSAGGWIRLDPSGDAVTDEPVDQNSIKVAGRNKPHARNRWVQLALQEQPPAVNGMWWTSADTSGKPDYAYVSFKKAVAPQKWFLGGSVNFDGVRQISDTNDIQSFFSVSGSVLRINLSKTASFANRIRTSGDMPFTLVYNPNNPTTKAWPAKQITAKDSAAPVVAKAVLRTGALKKDGKGFNEDTLTVYYSEPLNTGSARLNNAVTLRSSGSKYRDYQPKLRLHGSVAFDNETGFYKASYVLDDEFESDGNPNPYPETGDLLHINEEAGVGDVHESAPNVQAPNVQSNKDNKWVPLEIKPSTNWTAKIKGNPLASGGEAVMNVELSPNVKGAANVKVTAAVTIFDNLGTLVYNEKIVSTNGRIVWNWDGRNSKGRLVGTGAYLFRAVCDTDAEGVGRDVILRTLGVVRK